MFDLEREQLRKTYQLCRLASSMPPWPWCWPVLIRCSTCSATFEPGPVTWIQSSAAIQWLDAPIVWGCLIGATLLWGRWDHVSWQRRAGLFLVMNLVDVGLWFIARGDAHGDRKPAISGTNGCA